MIVFTNGSISYSRQQTVEFKRLNAPMLGIEIALCRNMLTCERKLSDDGLLIARKHSWLAQFKTIICNSKIKTFYALLEFAEPSTKLGGKPIFRIQNRH